jgi:hypothetical protein
MPTLSSGNHGVIGSIQQEDERIFGLSRLHRLYNRRRYYEELDNVTRGRGPAYLPVWAVEADQDSSRGGRALEKSKHPPII